MSDNAKILADFNRIEAEQMATFRGPIYVEIYRDVAAMHRVSADHVKDLAIRDASMLGVG